MKSLPSFFSSLLVLLVLTVTIGCQDADTEARADSAPEAVTDTTDVDPAVVDTVWFAGGCFWCMEPPFDRTEGVLSTISGFAGGTVENPSYRQVASGQTDHTETVQIAYDTTKVGIDRLLYVYWRNVDPLDENGQFCDRGAQYRPEIFVSPAHPDHKEAALASKDEAQSRFDRPIVVDVLELNAFYVAEDYHQNFYKKDPGRYDSYREGCGRDARLKALWGDEGNAPPKESR
ncbi:peptide-methionine (S)-S-oxide reductase [Longibacter salinarum]|uniref:Peptide methionine sulfoxide reductase MsrA n=1 Tax=Longibacter salinarum TaxID=1850348 RepID=A0A2A8D3I6_9BACT|nr:peptide-methionine (S)-S-oxide reductase MsrA [Longibacter salinarum]PEN15377.1 peptide-methionine (S)-S-oxide reductase [Longibacter salinarum]